MILEKNRETLLSDHRLISLLEELNSAIEATRRERIKSGVAARCSECGSQNRDCCGRGIELRYSVQLLLINLLLGVDLPNYRYREDSCCFLKPEGCCLKARDVFCVNYLCRGITDLIPPERLQHLRELEGKELNLIFKIEEALKRFPLSLTEGI